MNMKVGTKTESGIYAGLTRDGKHEIYVSLRTFKETRTQKQAIQACKDYAYGNKGEWTLPSVDELKDIAANSGDTILRVMPMSGFKDFWTRDQVLGDDNKVGYAVQAYKHGYRVFHSAKNTLLHVRPICLVEVKPKIVVTPVKTAKMIDAEKDLTIKRLKERVKFLERKIKEFSDLTIPQLELPTGA